MPKQKYDNAMTDTLIGIVTPEKVGQYGDAAAIFIEGYKGVVDESGNVVVKGLKQVAESKVNSDFEYQNIKQQAGFAAEIAYRDNVNAENIINGSAQRIYRSNDIGRGNDTVYDLLSVDSSGNPTWGAQMKFYGRFGSATEIEKSSKELVGHLASDKWERYRGRSVLVPSEQYQYARKYAKECSENYKAQASLFREQGNIEKAILLDNKAETYEQVCLDICNSGITSAEAVFIRKCPKLATAKYVAKTAHCAGIENAKSAAVISFAISSAQNILSLARGEKETDEAVLDIAADMVEGSGTAYIIASGSTIIKGTMGTSNNTLISNLSKGSVPAMIATAIVQTSKSLLKYTNGEIDSVELVCELGEKGTGMVAASFGASIGTLMLPGIGTIIGGMIGYLTSSLLYGACANVVKMEKLSAERRERIHALATVAIEAMTIQGSELNDSINKFYSHRQAIFSECISTLHFLTNGDDLEGFTKCLEKIAIEFGGVLAFENFDKFDEFMCKSDSVLLF